MLAAAREDNRENDAENMKPSCKKTPSPAFLLQLICLQGIFLINKSLGIICELLSKHHPSLLFYVALHTTGTMKLIEAPLRPHSTWGTTRVAPYLPSRP